jgi:hypothetical protein
MRKRKRSAVGEDTTARLSERDGLQKRSLPGGGSVWQGPLATEALESLDARAMTLDQSIIVSEDFDPGSAEDQALYAHEQFHVQQGDHGAGGHHIHSAEEIAARAVEGMVLHRSADGGGGGGESQGAGGDQGGGAAAKSGEPNPMGGYRALIKEGLDHQGAIDELARFVCDELDNADGLGAARNRDKATWK